MRELEVSADSLVAVVEDDEDVREALASLLGDAGYRVLQYAAADLALRDTLAGRRPDLILLDLMMPGMNGWQFRVEQLRRPELAEIPVITLSADTSAYAAAIDADAHLRKPVDADQLCAVVGQVLLAAERRRLAAKAIELEGIRSLGMLVASVAHEINNPLTYVTGHIELALMRSRELEAGSELGPKPSAQPLVASMESALDGVQRIAHIVRLLTTFARADSQRAPYDADVLRAIDAASRLAMHEISSRARLVCQLSPLPLVHATEGQLAQVFLNLLVNAAHAMPEGEAERHVIRINGRVHDRKVIIEIMDDGCGIAPELLSRIFEPFYTTKPLGLGTGLGLSISRDIVNGIGGSISVSSILGKGTTFRLELPTSASSQTHVLSGPSTNPPATPTRRILVVDDEPAVGRMIARALAGHHVETTVDPKDGIDRATKGEFDVVLCDLLMPSMTGIQVYDEIHRRKPDGSGLFVLMTGAARDDDLVGFLSEHDVTLLHKPFTLRELQQCLACAGLGPLTPLLC